MDRYRFYKCSQVIDQSYICNELNTESLYSTDITKPNIIIIDKMIPKQLDEIVIKYQLGLSTEIIVNNK